MEAHLKVVLHLNTGAKASVDVGRAIITKYKKSGESCLRKFMTFVVNIARCLGEVHQSNGDNHQE